MTKRARHIYAFGPFVIDTTQGLLLREGRPVPLTPKAFDTLVVLVETSGHVLSKDELMRRVWPDSFVEENNLSQNISLLRKALGQNKGDDAPKYIETVPKRGYRFTARVSARQDEGDEGVEMSGPREHTVGTRNTLEEKERDATGARFGRFKIRSYLGGGGMGEVYLAQDMKLGRPVALKLLSDTSTRDETRLRRFEQEARTASSLNHPNILTIYEIGQAHGAHFIATEFIDGETLRQHMAGARAQISLHEALDVAAQTAGALMTAHQAGVVHRDIKPENIMMRKDGYVKVLDFGLAKLKESLFTQQDADSQADTIARVLTTPGTVMGTVSYMSPEQARGMTVDERTDIWSLGCVLYEMITGRVPFEGATPSHVIVSILEKNPPSLMRYAGEIPDELERIVRKALAKEREERYQTAAEMLDDLHHLKQRLEIEAELHRSAQPARSALHGEGQEKQGAGSSSFSDQMRTTVQTRSSSSHGGAATWHERARESDPALHHVPETKYAQSGDVNIAYQIVGDGPLDLVFVMGWVSHLEYFWTEPSFARFLRRLASFSRLILFDKRGTGLSDRVPVTELPTLEQRMDDVRAVMDAVGSERAALCGVSEGGPMCSLFAATYPEKTAALVMIGTYAKRIWAPDYPWAPTSETRQEFYEEIGREWGGPVGLEERAPSAAFDPHFREWWATYLRMGASPGAALALTRMNADIDVRHVLPSIRVPALVLHRTGDACLKVEEGRYVAEKIPGAKFVELPGVDHLPFVGDQDAIINEVEEFLTGVRHTLEPDRVLATVLSARIAGSSSTEGEEHDWQTQLERYRAHARKEIEWFRGREIKMDEESFLATFDGPARAIRASCAINEAARRLGIEISAGLHTGECDMTAEDVSGIAVEISIEIADRASAGEILVSSTVKDLVAGSGIKFDERGAHALAAIPGEWRLFAVERGGYST